MELKFNSARILTGEGGVWLALKLPLLSREPARNFIDGLKEDTVYVAELKEYVPPRTRDQNAYYWSLVNKLAEVLRLSPNEIYREHIHNIGGNRYILPIRTEAVEDWKRIWASKGIGWVAEEIGPSKIEGFTNVCNFFGSSVYNRRQMSALLDICIQDCKEQGIETLTKEEIEELS